MKNIKTPELDKMSKVNDKSQVVGEFITWLKYEKKIYLMTHSSSAQFCPECDQEIEGYKFFPMTTQQLLADFFDVDLAKAEQERRALLDAVREENEKNSKSPSKS